MTDDYIPPDDEGTYDDPPASYEDYIAQYQEEGVPSGREGLRRYRAEGGRVRTFDWQQRWTEREDLLTEGIEPEYMPPWAFYTQPHAPMRRTSDPGRSRWFYWLRLVIQEPDGSIRDDQHYSYDSYEHLSDRAAVRGGVEHWNAMMRMAPGTGSLTGYAIGGWVTAVAPMYY